MIAAPAGRSDWSAGFWLFALRFYATPWFAWRWLARGRDGTPTPHRVRVTHLVMCGLRAAFLAMWVVLFIAALGHSAVFTAAFAAGIAFSAFNLVLRTQMLFRRYGGAERRS